MEWEYLDGSSSPKGSSALKILDQISICRGEDSESIGHITAAFVTSGSPRLGPRLSCSLPSALQKSTR